MKETLRDNLLNIYNRISTTIVGIDPDAKRSGVACIRNGKIEFLENMAFFDLYDYLSNVEHIKLVVIEAGWLNKGHWSISNRNEGQKHIQLKIAHDTGANHETGRKIVEMCEFLGLPVELVKPTKSKVDHQYFKKITGWTKRTNSETRDAAMLVFGRK